MQCNELHVRHRFLISVITTFIMVDWILILDEFKVKLCGVRVEEIRPVESVHGGKGGGQQNQCQPVNGGDDPGPLDVARQEENGAELNLRDVNDDDDDERQSLPVL